MIGISPFFSFFFLPDLCFVLSSLQSLDFETKSSYTLKIEASNKHVDPRFRAQGPFSDMAMVRLVVENVDEPPVFTMPVSRMVVSEAAKVGTIIGTISAIDPDSTNSPIRFGTRPRTDTPSSGEICVTVSLCLGGVIAA